MPLSSPVFNATNRLNFLRAGGRSKTMAKELLSSVFQNSVDMVCHAVLEIFPLNYPQPYIAGDVRSVDPATDAGQIGIDRSVIHTTGEYLVT